MGIAVAEARLAEQRAGGRTEGHLEDLRRLVHGVVDEADPDRLVDLPRRKADRPRGCDEVAARHGRPAERRPGRGDDLGRCMAQGDVKIDVAVVLGTPFVSGKDSLNNEFSYLDETGTKQTISIPPSLLISAMGQIDNVSLAVTMDAKESGNAVFLVGTTQDELGGSHYCLCSDQAGGLPTGHSHRAG